MLKLGIDQAALRAANGLHTACEIEQQSEMLLRTHELLATQRTEIEEFLKPLIGDPGVRIILTGAGTSAFIGECLMPVLNHHLAARVEAIATTDIVSAPHLWLEKNTKTLLVSFARSGNSPESKAVVELADELVEDIFHLIITCNKNGELAMRCGPNCLTIMLPEETHDRSFAMTSSFTCMTYAALAVLTGIEALSGRIGAIANATEIAIRDHLEKMELLAKSGYDRVVYLGSGVFRGLAREAALKLMELTDGRIVTAYDTPLGFRHGPKTIVTEQTLVMIFLSNDPLTRAYDLDLVDELSSDRKAGKIVTLSAKSDGRGTIYIPHLDGAQDIDLIFPFIVIPQIFAFFASLHRGLMPDSPNVTGTVNRVVQGVSIYKAVGA